MQTLYKYLNTFKFYSLAILTAIMILSLLALKNLGVDNSLNIWFVKNDPTLNRYINFQETFGGNETILLGLESQESFLTPLNVQVITSLTSDLEKIKYVSAIHSLSNFPIEIENNKLKAFSKATPEELKINLKTFESFLIQFLSQDTRVSSIIIELQNLEDIDEKRNGIILEIRNIVDKYFEEKHYHLAGIGVIYNELNELSIKDSRIFVSISYIIIIIFLFVFMRDFKRIGLTILTITIAIVITMGIFTVFDHKLNMINIVLPTLIMIVCIADIIHIVEAYNESANIVEPSQNISLLTLKKIFMPCLFTTLTTTFGFFSLYSADMKIIKVFGLFAGIGISISFIVTFLLFPFFKRTSPKVIAAQNTPALESYTHFLNTYKFWILSAFGLIFITISSQVNHINIDTFSLGYLSKENRIRKSSQFIEEKLGAYIPLEFTVQKDKGDFYKPENLKLLENFLELTKSNEHNAKTGTSIVEYLKLYNFLLNDKDISFYKIPNSEYEIRMLVEKIRKISDNRLENFIDSDFSHARISSRIEMLSAKKIKTEIQAIQEKAENTFKGETFMPGGYLSLYTKMIDYIVSSQIKSLIIACVVIFLFIGILLKSFKMVFLSIISNLSPLIVTLGIMSWFNIDLDIGNITIAAITLGLIVDDTIHFLFNLKKSYLKHNSHSHLAMQETLARISNPILKTSIILIAGFSIFVFSEISSIVYFGLLTGVTIFAALVVDLVVLPCLVMKNEQ